MSTSSRPATAHGGLLPRGSAPDLGLAATAWLAPLLWLPGVAWAGERVYRRVAAERAITCAVPAIRTP